MRPWSGQEFEWKEVQRLFVEEGWTSIRIINEFDNLNRLELARRAAAGQWRKLREAHLVEDVKKSVESLGLEGHEYTADQLVAVGKSIAQELMKDSLTKDETSRLRSRAEAFRTTVEATNIAIRLARDVRGLRLGQPSKTQEIDATTEVVYFTRVEDRKVETKEEAASA